MENKVYKKINELFKGVFENNVPYHILVSKVNGQNIIINGTQVVTININGEYNRFYFFYNTEVFRFHNIISNQVLQDYSKYLLNITLLKYRLEKNKITKEVIL